MKDKILTGFLVSLVLLSFSVGLGAFADDSELSPWSYTYDWLTQPAEWIYQYLKYGSRYDMQTKSNKIDYGTSLNQGINETTTIIPNPNTGEDEIQEINVNECYNITGKFVTISANGNKILYEISLTGYNYKLTSAPSASSDLWSKGGKVVLKKTDMRTGLTANYSFPVVLRGSSPFTVYTGSTSRGGVPTVFSVNYWYLDGATVRQATAYFGQTADNTIQVYDLPVITGYDSCNDVTSGYTNLLGTFCQIIRSTSSGTSSFSVNFILSSLDTNDNINANLITEKYFGGNFGLAPVFIDNTYQAGNSYNVNNIAPELGFDYINGQLEINADVLGAKIDLVLDHLIDLYNDFYSTQTAPYTSVTEGDTYNYIEVIQEPEPPVTYPPSTGGGGVPEEWLQHYPPIDTTPAILADVPDLSYFEDLAVIPSASPTIFTMISQLVVDSGLMGVFSITFILAVAMYFFRR